MKRYNYNPDKRHLIFLNAKGNPVFSLAGPIAERVYKTMLNNNLKIEVK